ncbi:MAG: hypothetical protein ACOCNS_00905 [Bacteroidales bacterium]
MNTNSTINAQVFQCLSYIADDEISKQKFCKDIVEVWQQMEDAKAGIIKGTSLKEFLNELHVG